MGPQDCRQPASGSGHAGMRRCDARIPDVWFLCCARRPTRRTNTGGACRRASAGCSWIGAERVGQRNVSGAACTARCATLPAKCRGDGIGRIVFAGPSRLRSSRERRTSGAVVRFCRPLPAFAKSFTSSRGAGWCFRSRFAIPLHMAPMQDAGITDGDRPAALCAAPARRNRCRCEALPRRRGWQPSRRGSRSASERSLPRGGRHDTGRPPLRRGAEDTARSRGGRHDTGRPPRRSRQDGSGEGSCARAIREGFSGGVRSGRRRAPPFGWDRRRRFRSPSAPRHGCRPWTQCREGIRSTPRCRPGSPRAPGTHLLEVAVPARSPKSSGLVEPERLGRHHAQCEIDSFAFRREPVATHDFGASLVVDVDVGACHVYRIHQKGDENQARGSQGGALCVNDLIEAARREPIRRPYTASIRGRPSRHADRGRPRARSLRPRSQVPDRPPNPVRRSGTPSSASRGSRSRPSASSIPRCC